MDFAVPADHSVKIKESEKRDKYLDLAREQITMEHEGDGDTNCDWCTWDNSQKTSKVTGRFENKRTIGDHLDYNIIKLE